MSTARTGASLALASMLCVQLGIAVSVGLAGRVGPDGAAWLRLVWAGLITLVVLRPRRGSMSGRALRTCVALGVITAGVTMLFMVAVSRLPMGTASALEFLGPLSVAVLRGRGVVARLAWPLLAGAGVLLLTEPWRGDVDVFGVAAALAAAACWAGYIVLTQRVGDEVEGVQGLAVSMPVAGLVATGTVLVLPGSDLAGVLTWEVLLLGAGLAVLLPVVPFALEMVALRHLTAAAFGTIMCLEPAIALVIGLVLLGQLPGPGAVVGLVLVVAAGLGAERSGARAAAGEDDATEQVVVSASGDEPGTVPR
ncbi:MULTISPECIES: EamA family transporter [unclassified Nocardioides]|uniref:EamA family transporter n=1 Tax=unclassified Nocardioides TaxID=2615069 RepID=UPI002405FC58|nr:MULTISPECIES: EamA family transporter [unclassified Nocardioides]